MSTKLVGTYASWDTVSSSDTARSSDAVRSSCLTTTHRTADTPARRESVTRRVPRRAVPHIAGTPSPLRDPHLSGDPSELGLRCGRVWASHVAPFALCTVLIRVDVAFGELAGRTAPLAESAGAPAGSAWRMSYRRIALEAVGLDRLALPSSIAADEASSVVVLTKRASASDPCLAGEWWW